MQWLDRASTAVDCEWALKPDPRQIGAEAVVVADLLTAREESRSAPIMTTSLSLD
jgi:hypothetical protein